MIALPVFMADDPYRFVPIFRASYCHRSGRLRSSVAFDGRTWDTIPASSFDGHT
jgi:hypothetical protein